MLFATSRNPVKSAEDSILQSPVWPRIVEMFIAKKNPMRIDVKFIIREMIIGIFFLIALDYL
jgi:hypothetical protein